MRGWCENKPKTRLTRRQQSQNDDTVLPARHFSTGKCGSFMDVLLGSPVNKSNAAVPNSVAGEQGSQHSRSAAHK